MNLILKIYEKMKKIMKKIMILNIFYDKNMQKELWK
jgi:hypothetical protein